jgi:hypothetical protein
VCFILLHAHVEGLDGFDLFLIHIDILQALMHPVIVLVDCTLAVQDEAVHLEEVKVVETHSDVPTPVKEQRVKLLRGKQLHQEGFSLVLRNDVQHLVEHPAHLG